MRTMNKKIIIILAIAVFIVIVRLFLPHLVKNYVNKTLQEMEGYTGSVDDIDLRIFRGAYVIKELQILKEKDQIPVPFVEIERIDLSVHWKALLHGSIAGEVILDRPNVNFAVSDSKESQDGSEADWLQTLDELMPIKINQFQIKDGKISFKDFSTNPEVDIFLDSLELMATNISNVRDKSNPLPSTLKAYAISLGNGNLNIDVKMNVLKKMPDFDLDLSFENVDLTALNNFVRAYAHADVEKGTFNFYTEMTAENGALNGYIKPVIQDLQILDWDKEEDPFLQKVWESVMEFVTDIFTNQEKNQFATKTSVTGDLNNLDVGIWQAVWNTFKNAFIEALSKRVEGTVDFTSKENKEKH